MKTITDATELAIIPYNIESTPDEVPDGVVRKVWDEAPLWLKDDYVNKAKRLLKKVLIGILKTN